MERVSQRKNRHIIGADMRTFRIDENMVRDNNRYKERI